MTFRAIARRNAGALFDVGDDRGSLERIGADLRQLRDLVAGHPQLQVIFGSAVVGPNKKVTLVQALIKSLGGMTVEVQRLLGLLAERDRLHLIDEIAELFEERLLARQHVVQAEVTTAAPLTDAARRDLTRALGDALTTEVRLTERVDPEIIGGITATVGGMVFDGSVTTQLERIRQRLHQR
jgi:F-type H+-transporting ATPase subunit delta